MLTISGPEQDAVLRRSAEAEDHVRITFASRSHFHVRIVRIVVLRLGYGYTDDYASSLDSKMSKVSKALIERSFAEAELIFDFLDRDENDQASTLLCSFSTATQLKTSCAGNTT